MRKILLLLLIVGGILMPINHHNFAYAAGPTYPEAVGDRYYTQDLARDYWSKIDDAGRKVASGFSAFPVLIKDSNITKGTLYTDINIPIARGIVKYEVDVPSSYAALPPTVAQEDIYCRIETTAQTDFDISSSATLDGVTINYVKVTYNETNGSSRARAKKAGTYVYEKAVSYTITVDSVAPTDYDLVLATLVGDGSTTLVIDSYTRTASYSSEYDYIVRTQEDWNILIDYTAANQYRIKDNVKSIFVKSLASGYQMTGATSPLQEGDSWGYIETNDCTQIVFEPGAFIDMHQDIGYLEVNTDYCVLKNVNIQGDMGAVSSILKSYSLSASYVLFENCITMNRLSDAIMKAFEGSGTAIHNRTSQYSSCKVTNIEAFDFRGFEDSQNLDRCIVYDCTDYGTGTLIGYRNCDSLQKCIAETLTANGSIGFSNSSNIEGCRAEGIASGTQPSRGYEGCSRINNSIAIDITSSSSTARGFSVCNNGSSNRAETCEDGFFEVFFFSDCISISNDNGYVDSANLSACFANTNTNSGFLTCEFLSACSSLNNSIRGYDSCTNINSSEANNNGGIGFFECNYISSNRSIGNGVDGYRDCVTVIGCLAVANTGDGYSGCNHIEHNRAVTNGGVAYNNCFADLAATRAAAATDSGGDNA